MHHMSKKVIDYQVVKILKYIVSFVVFLANQLYSLWCLEQ